jgi:hypothetical protein
VDAEANTAGGFGDESAGLECVVNALDRILLSHATRIISEGIGKKIDEMSSQRYTFMCTKKHDDICGCGVPALNSVGLACVKNFWDIRLYVSIAE